MSQHTITIRQLRDRLTALIERVPSTGEQEIETDLRMPPPLSIDRAAGTRDLLFGAQCLCLTVPEKDIGAAIAALTTSPAEGEAPLSDRESIARFLAREAERFQEAARQVASAKGSVGTVERLTAQAGGFRTAAAQVARGDDRLEE